MYNLNGIYLGLRKRANFGSITGWLGNLTAKPTSYKQPITNNLTNRVIDLESRNKILASGTKSLRNKLSKAKRWGKIGAIGAGVGALGLGMGLGKSLGGRDNYYY